MRRIDIVRRRVVPWAHAAVIVLAVGIAVGLHAAADVPLPRAAGSLKFAVIGDNGTGEAPQYETAQQMLSSRSSFPFDFVLMLGDNLYGSQKPQDFVTKFERPYGPLLDAGVRFYAALGNHDKPTNRSYAPFNMAGERYYTFASPPVRFFILDTNLMDRPQLTWIEETLERASEPWKIVSFHHPIYSDGDRHGSNVELRVMLEPLLVRHGVSVVFSGHEHIYERTTPQKGITYFVEGSSGQLRKGGVTPSSLTAASFADDRTFMLVEIANEQLFFQTLSRTGRVVDSGVIERRSDASARSSP
jgi:predicted MPP superfamily phosphohydrolase